jgi:hypothetical protein
MGSAPASIHHAKLAMSLGSSGVGVGQFRIGAAPGPVVVIVVDATLAGCLGRRWKSISSALHSSRL